MSLRDFLSGLGAPRTPLVPPFEVPSLEATLGLREPIEWRSEPAFAPAVSRAQRTLAEAVAREAGEEPDAWPRTPVWPFHVDAQGGVVTVEWWGDLGAPVRMPVEHGDEAAELVARYGDDMARTGVSLALRVGTLGRWWHQERVAPLIEEPLLRVLPPRALACTALYAAASVLEWVDPALSPSTVLDQAIRRYEKGPGRDGETDDLRDAAAALDARGTPPPLSVRASFDVAAEAADVPVRHACNALASAVRAVLAAEPGRGDPSRQWHARDALGEAVLARVALTPTGPKETVRAAVEWDYARLARRFLPYGPLVHHAVMLYGLAVKYSVEVSTAHQLAEVLTEGRVARPRT